MDIDYLKTKVSYDPETGLFTRLSAKAHNAAGGSINKAGYRVISIDNKPYYCHRLAIAFVYGYVPEVVDHINGNRSDNRISNLRSATRKMNAQNRHRVNPNSKTGLLGVLYHGKLKKEKVYSARIHTDGVNYDLGYFKTPEEAHAAYLEAKKKYHKEVSND